MTDMLYPDDHDWLSCTDCEEDFCCGDCSSCYQEFCEDRYEPYEGEIYDD